MWVSASNKDRFTCLFTLQWYYEGDKVGSGMDEGIMGGVWGLLLIGGGVLAYRIEKCNVNIKHQLEIGMQKIEQKGVPSLDIEELKEELEDLIAETIGSMRQPQMIDHLGGILQQWAQIKFAKEMQTMNMMGGLELPLENEDLT